MKQNIQQKRLLALLISLIIVIIAGQLGIIGEFLFSCLEFVVGVGTYIFLAYFLSICLLTIFYQKTNRPIKLYIILTPLILVSFLSLLSFKDIKKTELISDYINHFQDADYLIGGGFIGHVGNGLLSSGLSETLIILILGVIILSLSIILIYPLGKYIYKVMISEDKILEQIDTEIQEETLLQPITNTTNITKENNPSYLKPSDNVIPPQFQQNSSYLNTQSYPQNPSFMGYPNQYNNPQPNYQAPPDPYLNYQNQDYNNPYFQQQAPDMNTQVNLNPQFQPQVQPQPQVQIQPQVQTQTPFTTPITQSIPLPVKHAEPTPIIQTPIEQPIQAAKTIVATKETKPDKASFLARFFKKAKVESVSKPAPAPIPAPVAPVVKTFTPPPIVTPPTPSLDNDAIDESYIPFSNVDDTTYQLPPLSLLKDVNDSGKNSINIDYAQSMIEVINQKFKELKIAANVVNYTIGPAVTRFEVQPEPGVRVNAIANIKDDLMLVTSAKSIRVEAPIPGKAVVGIEIPNAARMRVPLKDILMSIPYSQNNERLLMGIGKDIDGVAVTARLNKMLHLLIGGATGSGKSVCINSLLISLLMRCKPSELRLLIIDPKKVEMVMYNDIPHLLTPVISDPKKAAIGLTKVCNEMDRRYTLMATVACRNIDQYNAYCAKNNSMGLPYIVVIIDELADLMLVSAKDVESQIQRLTQAARAAGIHLIVATQRPSVDVVTGIIKANLPSRIAFAVASAHDNRTIIEEGGAQHLLGMGDMLIKFASELHTKRVQGTWIDDDDIEKVIAYVKSQAPCNYEPEFVNLTDPKEETFGSKDNDQVDAKLLQDVKEFIKKQPKISTSMLQRYFNIGFSKAARILEQLEIQGLVGPQNGTKPREVIND